MITKFKIFETANDELEIGDYVICDVSVETNIKDRYYESEQRYKNFLRNNIGKYIKNEPIVRFSYLISYENIPDEFSNFIRKVEEFPNLQIVGVERSEIIVNSKNIEDLEIKLAVKKYNI